MVSIRYSRETAQPPTARIGVLHRWLLQSRSEKTEAGNWELMPPHAKRDLESRTRSRGGGKGVASKDSRESWKLESRSGDGRTRLENFGPFAPLGMGSGEVSLFIRPKHGSDPGNHRIQARRIAAGPLARSKHPVPPLRQRRRNSPGEAASRALPSEAHRHQARFFRLSSGHHMGG
jgi:hypothetical protein